jgi:hypothetical protein
VRWCNSSRNRTGTIFWLYNLSTTTYQGDSGGPLQVRDTNDDRWYLVGITSFGDNGDTGLLDQNAYPGVIWSELDQLFYFNFQVSIHGLLHSVTLSMRQLTVRLVVHRLSLMLAAAIYCCSSLLLLLVCCKKFVYCKRFLLNFGKYTVWYKCFLDLRIRLYSISNYL